MQDYEERFDNIEVMLGRLIIENDKAQHRQDKALARLTALVERNEKRAEVDRQRAEEDRQRAEIDRQRAEQDRNRQDKALAGLTALVERNEKRADEDRQRAEIDRQRAEEDRNRQDNALVGLTALVERNEKRAEEDRSRQDKALVGLTALVERNEKRAEEDRKYWNKRWGELSDKMGSFVEDIVAPNIPTVAKELFGCEEVDDLMVRRFVRNKKDPSKRREFDVIAVCGDKLLLNETKSTVRIDYINAFVDMLPEFCDYFPEYTDKTIVPVFSSLNLSQDIVNYLSKHKIYALAMGDENMQLLNRAAVEKGK
jgi:hypothetical protein